MGHRAAPPRHGWHCCDYGNGWIDNGLLHESGAVSWAGAFQRDSWRYVAEVPNTDADGGAVRLDSHVYPEPLDTNSLALDGRTVTWRHSGATRSAELR